MHMNIIWVVFLFWNLNQVWASCVMQADGSFPPPGSCSGPIQRAGLRYASNSTGCPNHMVSYLIDNGATVACGSCKPGETGLGFSDIAAELSLALSLANYNPGTQTFPFQSGAIFSCLVNEFCNDNAVCIPLKESPLYGLPCPSELPTNGWCGPGLHCIQHICKVCVEGVINAPRTRVCLNGEWISDPWTLAIQDPAMILLIIIVALLAVQIIIVLFIIAYKCYTSKEIENSQTIELFETTDSEDEVEPEKSKPIPKELSQENSINIK